MIDPGFDHPSARTTSHSVRLKKPPMALDPNTGWPEHKPTLTNLCLSISEVTEIEHSGMLLEVTSKSLTGDDDRAMAMSYAFQLGVLSRRIAYFMSTPAYTGEAKKAVDKVNATICGLISDMGKGHFSQRGGTISL